jgi:hypothetical protein
MINNRKEKINHPMADTISISTGEGVYSGDNTSEIAFFQNRKWVTIPVPEFSEYHDGSPSDAISCVYTWVPNDLIESFLNLHRA